MKKTNIVITGAAGLVGQNLVTLLAEYSEYNIVAIDKHSNNLAILHDLHPDVTTVCADLAKSGDWHQCFENADVVVLLHAQITGKTSEPFIENNITATENVLAECARYQTSFIVHVSSSVVISVADDDYTSTKKQQEELVTNSGIPHCVLRPSLMFGWFDPKHLGWLARFMEKTPVFPVPGSGKFLRQPLYNLDFCRVIKYCIDHRPQGKTYNLIGTEKIFYIDIIRAIKRIKRMNVLIVRIPYWLFWLLLRIYAIFTARPPFTVDQLKALTAGDIFEGVNMTEEFGIEPTPFDVAMKETLLDERYSGIVLEEYL